MRRPRWGNFGIAGFAALVVCVVHGAATAAEPVQCSGPFPGAGMFPERLDRYAQAAGEDPGACELPPLPPGFVPWWQEEVAVPNRNAPLVRPVDLGELFVEALNFSPQVRAVRETAAIQSTYVVESAADFDLQTFMESKFVRLSEPVGDKLTTGGPPRLRDSDWFYKAGIRQRVPIGGELELSQRIGYHDNNSLFIDPANQGNARFTVSYSQPLLNGAGRAYNEARIVLAELDLQAARDEVAAELQKHLVEVAQAYWDLYLRRAIYLQKHRHYGRGRAILQRLEDRLRVDSLQSQVLTAQATVALRYADLNRAAMAIRNAEARIRTLVNAPSLYDQGPLELIPASPPSSEFACVPLRDALVTALARRPDVDQAMQQTRMASVRLEVSSKELLPILNMVLETYVAGLEGQVDIGQAWLDQFSVGEPTYTAGLVFERPWGNRAARARHERHLRQLRQVTSELEATMDRVMLEVELTHREVHTAYRDILANYRSMAATRADVDYLFDRWTALPGDDRSASFMLEDLLKAQDRLADAEFSFAEAQYRYVLAHVRLQQAMGTLLAVDALPVVESFAPTPAEATPDALPEPQPVEQLPLPPPPRPVDPEIRSAELRRLPRCS